MGTLIVSGNLTAGPAAGGGNVFPAASFNAPLNFELGFQSGVGVLVQTLNTPAPNFITLSGIGAAQAVVAANFLYLRSDSQLLLRLTNDDGSGGSTVQTIPLHGTMILQFPNLNQLQLLEAQGSGKIEYAATGPT